MTEPRVLVFAYHDVGYECLSVLFERGVKVIAVYTHVDDPNEHVWYRSVAALARAHAVPVFTPENVNSPEWIARIHELAPDLILSFYYRHLIAPELLKLPDLGAFNMHGSLLPKYRGRAPVNWAVLNGESETGVTLHVMVQRPDAGAIVDQEAVPIGPEDTARVVLVRVTAAARTVLERRLPDLLTGRAARRAQDEKQATYYSGRRPEDGRIDWHRDARSIFNLVRAVTHPFPGAFTDMDGRRLFIWWARPVGGAAGRPGEVASSAPLRVSTGKELLEVTEWQWQGDLQPSRGDGHGLRPGLVLGTASTRSNAHGTESIDSRR